MPNLDQLPDLPKETEDTYSELASEATSPEEADALREMHEADQHEREQALSDIGKAKPKKVDANGVVRTENDGDDDAPAEYGQGGPRA